MICVQYAILARTENLQFAVNGWFMHRQSHFGVIDCRVSHLSSLWFPWRAFAGFSVNWVSVDTPHILFTSNYCTSYYN